MFGILTQKKCLKCGEVKELSDFHKDKNRKDGHFPYCRVCQTASCKARRLANPERQKEIQRKAAAKQRQKPERQIYMKIWQKENKERVAEKIKKYIAAHPEQRHQTVHRWIDNNIDKVRANTKKWRENNPDKTLEHRHKRRVREIENGGNFTAAEWRDLRDKYGNKCIVPGCERTDLSPDHVIPISKGGSNSISNIQPLCRHHNFTKNAKVIDYR